MRSRLIERTRNAVRARMPSGMTLLVTGEKHLQEGRVRDAHRLFRAIVDGYPPSLEKLAAQSYLRSC